MRRDDRQRLKEQRFAAVGEMRSLIQTAELEDRGLTDDEAARFDQHEREAEKLELRSRAAERLYAAEQDAEQFVAPAGRGYRTAGEREGGGRHARAGDWLATEVRALVGSGSTGGGAFTPVDTKTTFFDLLAAKSVALRSGISKILTDKDSVIVPRLTADAATGWVSEAGTISENQVMPWRIEDAAREGANYVQGGLWKPFAVRDGRLITGQQQYSGRKVAELVIEALGR
jgi:HK97 family phage major capsid protein